MEAVTTHVEGAYNALVPRPRPGFVACRKSVWFFVHAWGEPGNEASITVMSVGLVLSLQMWLRWSFRVGGLSLWCYAWAGQIHMEGWSGLWGGYSVWGVCQLWYGECVWVVGVGWIDRRQSDVWVCLIRSDTVEETQGALSFLYSLSTCPPPPSLPPSLPPSPSLSPLPSLPPSRVSSPTAISLVWEHTGGQTEGVCMFWPRFILDPLQHPFDGGDVVHWWEARDKTVWNW